MFVSGLIVASALQSEQEDLGRRQLLDCLDKNNGIPCKHHIAVDQSFTSTARIAGVTGGARGGTADAGTSLSGGTLQQGSQLRKRSHAAKKSARLF
ncbi:g9046 [Coccomyxa elongata]